VGLRGKFSNELISEAYRHWDTNLGLFVTNLCIVMFQFQLEKTDRQTIPDEYY